MSRANAWARMAAAVLAACACAGSTPTEPYGLPYDPANFVAGVTNPFFPLVPGTTFSFAETNGPETGTVEVTTQTKTIQGIVATTVWDRVYVAGQLTEETYDWYAQDAQGNVWYLGEDSREIQGGKVVSTEGSWQAGVDGAKPGIIMWANPAAHVGEEYFQEYYPGNAMDKGKVVAVGVAVQVPAGSYTGCIETEDWNPLEGSGREHKFYCPQVGLVKESGGSQLVHITRP